MKRLIFFLLAWFLLIGTAYPASRTTVTKDSAGYIGRVTGYVTESGQTVFEVDSAGGITIYYSNLIPQSGASIWIIGESGKGYIAVYGSTSTVTGTPEISGVSLIKGSMPGNRLLGTDDLVTSGTVSGGITRWFVTGNSVAPTWVLNTAYVQPYGSGTSIQIPTGITTYLNAYMIIKGRAGVSVWGYGCAANSSNGTKFHSDFGSATTGIWANSGDYDASVVLKSTQDTSGASRYWEVQSITGSWYNAVGNSL